jgi:hypothetical protein
MQRLQSIVVAEADAKKGRKNIDEIRTQTRPP